MSSQVSLVIGTLILLDQSPIFMNSFNLNYFFRGPFSGREPHMRVRASTYELGLLGGGGMGRHNYSVHDKGTEREERRTRHSE